MKRFHQRQSKERSQTKHAIRRGVERYGVVLSKSDIAGLVSQIQSGEGRLIEKQSLRVSIWEVTLRNGSTATVVYDKSRKTIATLLPPELIGDSHGQRPASD
jgi:hypothetical protein